MRTLAVVPIKSFHRAKQRLAEAVAPEVRRELAEAMFGDVLGALHREASIESVVVVTGDPRARSLARANGADVVEDRSETGQSDAAELGIARAIELGIPRVLLVPGDTPALAPADLAALLSHPAPGIAIVPDRHGTGTNALLLAPADAMAPGFGPGSLERHRERAAASGVPFAVVELPTLGLDVDTPEDLLALRERLASRHGGAPRTRGVLDRVARAAEAMAS